MGVVSEGTGGPAHWASKFAPSGGPESMAAITGVVLMFQVKCRDKNGVATPGGAANRVEPGTPNWVFDDTFQTQRRCTSKPKQPRAVKSVGPLEAVRSPNLVRLLRRPVTLHPLAHPPLYLPHQNVQAQVRIHLRRVFGSCML